MAIQAKTQSRPGYDIEVAKAILDTVAQKLQSAKWFVADKWLVSVHHFPPAPAAPESVTMHVYKSHWYNETRQGIHFETQLGPEQMATQTIPVMLHIFHSTTVPGTNLKRIKVSKPFVDYIFETVSVWEGYSFRVGKYGTQPFTCKLKFSENTLVEQLHSEFSRLCCELGPTMDRVLKDVVLVS